MKTIVIALTCLSLLCCQKEQAKGDEIQIGKVLSGEAQPRNPPDYKKRTKTVSSRLDKNIGLLKKQRDQAAPYDHKLVNRKNREMKRFIKSELKRLNDLKQQATQESGIVKFNLLSLALSESNYMLQQVKKKNLEIQSACVQKKKNSQGFE